MKLKHKILKSDLKIPINYCQHLGLEAQDTFIVSYPKSGSTWFRFVLYELLTDNHATFEKVNYTIPTIGKHFGKDLETNYGRFIKSHEPFRKDYGKAVVMVRDVRDVIISEFNYNKKMGFIKKDFPFNDFINQFVEKSVNRFGNYAENLNSWITAKENNKADILFIKYEDMKADPYLQFSKVNTFLDLNRNLEFIKQKIENNTVAKMQKKEQLSNDRTLKSADASIPFVRKGTSRQWVNVYSTEQLDLIENNFEDILLYFKYK
ncbi:sulfotransferase domain-containing protein [Christiangramia echinicola]|uniref:Sulfotransferase domain-containing protein n=1 Tax=Christiangramia echinicola TaxID=279359 RepID=A0A1H1LTZ8_9FLAO|nr:sulfotransferase domain-containing protein [Christiangramia echinicola]SDR77991.1 Sulfotransferase domain-containing protein [Christiangramia echinicola]